MSGSTHGPVTAIPDAVVADQILAAADHDSTPNTLTGTEVAPTSVPAPDLGPVRLDHPCRVLLVDDREERRSLMRMVVQTGHGGGIVVAEAATVATAVADIDRYSVDAAVVEIQIPVATGLAVISALRAEHPSLVIVVCSFHADTSTQRQAYLAGADAYLTKPTGPSELLLACRTPSSTTSQERNEARQEPAGGESLSGREDNVTVSPAECQTSS